MVVRRAAGLVSAVVEDDGGGFDPDTVVAAGGVYLDPGMAGKVVGGFVRRSTEATPAGGELSDREAEVVRQTAAGFSSKEIAAELSLSIKTVETYRARAMEKLGLDSRSGLVRYAVQQGWLQDG